MKLNILFFTIVIKKRPFFQYDTEKQFRDQQIDDYCEQERVKAFKRYTLR